MVKSVFVGIFTFLGLLSFTEAIVVGLYIWNKFGKPKRKKKSSADSVVITSGPARHLRPSMIDNIHYSFIESTGKSPTASVLSEKVGYSSSEEGGKAPRNHQRQNMPSTSHWLTLQSNSESDSDRQSCLITGQLTAVSTVTSDSSMEKRPADKLIKSVRSHLVKRRPPQQTYQYFNALPAICDSPNRSDTARSDRSYPSTIDFDPNHSSDNRKEIHSGLRLISGGTDHRSLKDLNENDHNNLYGTSRASNQPQSAANNCPLHGKSQI